MSPTTLRKIEEAREYAQTTWISVVHVIRVVSCGMSLMSLTLRERKCVESLFGEDHVYSQAAAMYRDLFPLSENVRE